MRVLHQDFVRYTIICFLCFLQCKGIQAAPSLEPCPPDSIQSEDTCKCDESLCHKPPCPYTLTLISNATTTPGECCPQYSCQGCPVEDLIPSASPETNQSCPCAPNATLVKNECRCVDPHRHLLDGNCTCDASKCPLPPTCESHSVAVTVKTDDNCCSDTHCILCPEDSFPTESPDISIVEDKCVCYPCEEKYCGPDESPVILRSGTNIPSRCCDVYRCEATKKCTNATGESMEEGEKWETPDGQSCLCQNGIAFCENDFMSPRSCRLEDGYYQHGESWFLDSCTNCTCLDGEKRCIAHMCEHAQGRIPVAPPRMECPELDCGGKVCADGFRVNKKGCQTCKCLQSQPQKYDDLLNKYNITRNDLREILREHFEPKTTSSTTAGTTTSSSSSSNTGVDNKQQVTTILIPPTDESLLTPPIYIIMALVLIFGLAVIAFALVKMGRTCGKRGSYDTNPSTRGRLDIYQRVRSKGDDIVNNCIRNNSIT